MLTKQFVRHTFIPKYLYSVHSSFGKSSFQLRIISSQLHHSAFQTKGHFPGSFSKKNRQWKNEPFLALLFALPIFTGSATVCLNGEEDTEAENLTSTIVGSKSEDSSEAIAKEDAPMIGDQSVASSTAAKTNGDKEEDKEEEEEEEEEETSCAFCKYMRAGPCGKHFRKWEKCLKICKEQEIDFVTECKESTVLMYQCMHEYPEYYKPVFESKGGGSDDDKEQKDNDDDNPPPEKATVVSEEQNVQPTKKVENNVEQNEGAEVKK